MYMYWGINLVGANLIGCEIGSIWREIRYVLIGMSVFLITRWNNVKFFVRNEKFVSYIVRF